MRIKRWVYLVGNVATLLVLLVASLGQVREARRRLSSGSRVRFGTGAGVVPPGASWLWFGVVTLVLVVLIVAVSYNVYRLLTGADRQFRRRARVALNLGVVGLGALALASQIQLLRAQRSYADINWVGFGLVVAVVVGLMGAASYNVYRSGTDAV